MMIAGVVIGFAAGRMSAWFVPFDSRRPVVNAGPQEARRVENQQVPKNAPQPLADGKSSKPPIPLDLSEKASNAQSPQSASEAPAPLPAPW
jgi:hypothetical protein